MDRKTKTLQIISFGWPDKTQADKFAKSAIIDAKLGLLRPTTNTPGYVFKNNLENSEVSILQNGIKYDVVINLIVSNCLDWMDNSISEELTKSHYFHPILCHFINE